MYLFISSVDISTTKTQPDQSYFSSAINFSFSFYIILSQYFLFLYSFSSAKINSSSFYIVFT